MPTSNLQIKRGDTSLIILTTTISGLPYDLSGHSIWMTAKLSEDDNDLNAPIRKDNINGGQGGIVINQIILPATVANTATVTIDPIDTYSLGNNSILHYDVQIKSPSNVVTTVAEGIMRVSNDITRSS